MKLYARIKALDSKKVDGMGSNDCLTIELSIQSKVVYTIHFDGKGVLLLNEVGEEISDNEV